MTDIVKTKAHGGIGHITLNRPEALHALNLPMCEAIHSTLQDWREDDAVKMVLIGHEDRSRGFCAGGDIAMLAESGKGDGQEARAFFAEEYRMNAAIKSFPKPYLAIMDGVTMGGGVGLSVHGDFRVATERTLFAMPETGIGLFPDVGGGWFLPRLQGELGTWLALTGARLKGSDVFAAGVATHFIPSDRLPELRLKLEATEFGDDAATVLSGLLAKLSEPAAPGSYEAHLGTINQCFAHDRAEAIVEALERDGGEWASKQAATIREKSPETVKVALRQVREGAACETFEENMAMEYRIGWRKVQSADFLEGVRAVIIDKDHNPKWSPATLESVSAADVDRYFARLGENELSFD